ncbi:MAG: hypothetical protein H6Q89_5369 [Myxococcaceae bacterium]|nr:hypothetical protein [Myxococcaceae bacterium]
MPAAPVAPPGGWGPTAPGATPTRGDAFGVLTSRVTERLAPLIAGKSNFELVPGRYPDAVGLPQVLAALGSSPQGQAAVTALLGQLQQKTGIAVPPEVQALALSHPEQATRAFEVTPKQIAAGMDGINSAYHAGKVKQVEPRKFALPQKFDLANLDAAPWTRAKPEMKELAPGLFSGDLPSATPDAELKRNTVMAEVFQRLSSNPGSAEKFEAAYGGKSFTRLDDLLGALKADGYEVNVSFQQRVANFANLKTAVPGSTPPVFLDVPAPLMIKTGMVDSTGKEAVVPSAHSEMIVSLRAGPNTRGPKLDCDQKFYQGVSGTGFFPVGSFADPKWCGKSTLAELKGDKALEAVKLAGVFTDVVQQSARKLDLYADGYGITGVCNDSVAVIEQATTGRAHEYPLLMKDSALAPELERRLSDADPSDDALCQTLKKAIRDLPSDVRQNASSRERAKASIPWAAGREPFASTVDARKILGG